MKRKLGIIAGSGGIPFFLLKEAKRQGYSCVVAAVKGEADSSLNNKTDIFEWIDMSEVIRIVSFFKEHGIKDAVFAGKIDSRMIYEKEKLDKVSVKLLADGIDKTPTSIIKTAIEFLGEYGIKIIDPTHFISSAFCKEGVLTEVRPSPDIEEDIAFGWEIAKKIADMDIGQTVIVKDKAVVAVEGLEGTNESIKRGGLLAGKGIVVIKVGRSKQDARIDLPAVGLNTVENLVESGGKVLCFEAKKVPFFQKEQGIVLANTSKISIVAR